MWMIVNCKAHPDVLDDNPTDIIIPVGVRMDNVCCIEFPSNGSATIMLPEGSAYEVPPGDDVLKLWRYCKAMDEQSVGSYDLANKAGRWNKEEELA